ncbi:MAG: outer membrane beta-barrel protein [Crocinitomicaceae bacterium]|nr:outer membrane beta-barrel protein [Crocinitomicaceae bacterium]
MKTRIKHKILISSLMLLLFQSSFAQDEKKFVVDEIQVSINRTNVEDFNTDDRIGFGFGAYHSFFAAKKLNLLVGLEYNRTSQFKNSMYNGHYSQAKNMRYNLNAISIPVDVRYNIGSNIKFFVEAGAFADLLIRTNRIGTVEKLVNPNTPQQKYENTEVNERTNISNSYGIHFGIGVRIPVSDYEIVIKPDYKLGLNNLSANFNDMYNSYFRLNVGLRF